MADDRHRDRTLVERAVVVGVCLEHDDEMVTHLYRIAQEAISNAIRHGKATAIEIGTLGAYSTIWMARAVGADGRIVTIEAEERNAAVARAIGCDEVRTAHDVPRACDAALAGAGQDDAVLVAGSLYVAGAARTYLRRIL